MKTETTLDQRMARDGAVFDQAPGRRLALHYGDPAAEYAGLTDGCGVVDLGPRTRVELAGQDAAPLLNRLCTNKVDDLAPGSGREAFLTDAKGHVLAWLWVFGRPGMLVLEADAGQAGKIIRHLDYYVIREKAEFHDRSASWHTLLVAGDDSGGVLGRLLAAPLPSEHLAHVDAELAGATVWVRRIELGPRTAFLLGCPAADAGGVWQAVREAGARPCGSRAAEAVRIEAGWPCSGRDVTEENLPQEVGRDDRAISFRKGCYLGQETVARLDSRGHVNKRLLGLRLDGREVPVAGTELIADGKPAARITSAALSPGFDAVVALGYARRGHDAPGARLAWAGGEARAVALPMPRPDK